jgi:hypothetical protein
VVGDALVLCSAPTATPLLLQGLDLDEFTAEFVERHLEPWLLFGELIKIAD